MIDVLDEARDYAAVEGTDLAIAEARNNAWWREHDRRYRAMWRETWEVICPQKAAQ